MAERLKKEEKEREERRKRVEAIMSRTRAKTAANNSTSNTPNKVFFHLRMLEDIFSFQQDFFLFKSYLNPIIFSIPIQAEDDAGNNDENNTELSQPSTQSEQNNEMSANNTKNSLNEYEKSVTDKENAIINSFSNLIENNLISTTMQQSPQHQHADNNGLHNNLKTNGKLLDFTLNDEHQPPISNGNGHTLINSLDNKM